MLNRTRATIAAMCGVAALALVVIAGGVTYAATNVVPAAITACVHHSGGGLYMAAKCAAHDSSLTWNVKGPAGPRGAPGLSLFVRADETGQMFQHSAGATVTKDTTYTGTYHVFFKQNISKCAVVVSQGEPSNNGYVPGVFYEAIVQSDPFNDNNPHEVVVYSVSASGSVNAGFDLIVAC